MTDTSREAVERLLNGVTPGPWTVEYKHVDMLLLMGNDCQMCDMTYYPWTPDEPADWEFIAASRDLVPALLARAEAAEAERDAMKASQIAAIRAIDPADLEKLANAVWSEYHSSLEEKWTFRKEHVLNAMLAALRAIEEGGE